MRGVPDRVRDGVWFAVPQATEGHHVRDQIDAAFIFAGGGLRKRASVMRHSITKSC